MKALPTKNRHLPRIGNNRKHATRAQRYARKRMATLSQRANRAQ